MPLLLWIVAIKYADLACGAMDIGILQFSFRGNNYKAYFDDGDFAILDSSRIKAIYWKVGTKVECNWLGRGIYYPGKITSMDGDRIHIFYDDGDEENTVVGRCRSK